MDKVFNTFSDNVIVIGNDNKIKFCNNSLLTKLEYQRNEIVGAEISQLLPNKHDLEMIVECARKNNNNEIILNFIARFNNKIKCLAKITEGNWNDEEAIFIISKQYNDELYTTKDLECLLDEIKIPIAMKDTKGKYIYVNNEAVKDFKISRESFIGKSEEEVFGYEIGRKFSNLDKKVIKTKHSRIDKVRVRTGDGNIKFTESHRTPIINSNGEVDRIIKMSKDITLKESIDKEFKKSFDLISTFDNILESDAKEKNVHKALDNIQNYLMDYLNADGINIWVYDNETEMLTSKVRCGVVSQMVGQDVSFKIDKNYITNAFVDSKWEGMKPLDGQIDLLTFNELKKHDISYRGVYKISYGNEFLGTLGVVYKQSNTAMIIQDDLIKSMCDRIGLIIKNQLLSDEVKKEFHRRSELEKELEDFLETSVDLIAIIDNNGKFIKVNEGWIQTLGWTQEELIEMSYRDIIAKEDIQLTSNIAKLSMKKDQVVRGLINRYRAKSGEIKWLEWSFKYIQEKEIFLGTAKDITEQKNAEEQKKFYEKNLELEYIKNEFFANISHEFKTPLNIILATMQLINKNIDNNKIVALEDVNLNRYMNSIKQNSYRLLRLVSNLIDITRIDTGYYKLNLENHNIIEVIEDITMSVAQFIEDKGISLVFDTEVEEEIIACDPDKIERIMLNLLSNAIKYTSVNGEINVNIYIEANNVSVSVKDDGIGIPADKVSTIFDRFTQVDNSLTRKNQGSGIGLSLVKSLVEMHDGTIVVRSEEGQGTEFIFKLPIKVIKSDNDIRFSESKLNTRVEKCNVEFSDIYEA